MATININSEVYERFKNFCEAKHSKIKVLAELALEKYMVNVDEEK